MNNPNEALIVPSPEALLLVARNAKFISLGKQQGNKCLIVILGIRLRRVCLQLSASSCGTQTHLTLSSEGQKKGESSGKQGSSKLPVPISLQLRTCFLMHLFLHPELLLPTLPSFRKSYPFRVPPDFLLSKVSLTRVSSP